MVYGYLIVFIRCIIRSQEGKGVQTPAASQVNVRTKIPSDHTNPVGHLIELVAENEVTLGPELETNSARNWVTFIVRSPQSITISMRLGRKISKRSSYKKISKL